MTPAETAARLLQERHGLRFEGVSWRRLERALGAAAAAAGRTAAEHARALCHDRAVLADLLDRATLPETSWFRDPAVFGELVQHVARAARRRPGETVTVWSAGCAHGQEPHALVMGLLEIGVGNVRVVATDVAPSAVQATAEARYPERALRGLSDERRRRWLVEQDDDGLFAVVPQVAERVEAVRHSLVADAPPVEAGSCPLVLCRNVLIYLAPEAVVEALTRLCSALEPGGLLVLGAGEAIVRRVEGLSLTPLGRGFAYSRDGAAPVRPVLPSPPAPPVVAVPAPAPVDAVPAATDRVAAAPACDHHTEPAPAGFSALLAEGERAAAAGDHGAAAAAFRHAAALDPGAPLAHLGLALALDALGDPGARRAYRAALQTLERPSAILAEDLGGFRVEELARMLAGRVTREPA